MFRFKHLPQVCMTYTTHMCLSLRLSALFFKGSVQAFIHAFIPDVLTKSSSTVNQTVTEILEDANSPLRSFTPRVDLLQMKHTGLYTRLFRS